MRRKLSSRKSKLAQWAGAAQYARAAAPDFFKRYRRESKRAVAPAPFTPHPKRWPDEGLHAAWLGHSTVLLKIDGFTILTDPILSERCGVGMGPVTVGIKRLVAPAIARAQLPPIDLILLSHAHFDHFDLRTLRSLERSGAAVVTAKNTSDLLRVRRYKGVHEVGWGERMRVGPAFHPRYSGKSLGRTATDRHTSRLQRLSHRDQASPRVIRRGHSLYGFVSQRAEFEASRSSHPSDRRL